MYSSAGNVKPLREFSGGKWNDFVLGRPDSAAEEAQKGAALGRNGRILGHVKAARIQQLRRDEKQLVIWVIDG